MRKTPQTHTSGKEFVSFDKAISLFPDQQRASNTILNRFFDEKGKFPTQLLPAGTGWGKTRVALNIAHQLAHQSGLIPMVVCPATLKPQWMALFAEFGLPCLGFYSYDAIRGHNNPWLARGREKKGPFWASKHLMATLQPADPENPLDSDVFSVGVEFERLKNGDIKPTKFEEIRRVGIFFIFDEMQRMKNDSAQHFACFELIRAALCEPGCTGRVLHLTASPIDKQSCWINFFRSMCFITAHEDWCKFNPGRQTMEYRDYTYGKLLKYCAGFNPVKSRLMEGDFQPVKAGDAPKVLTRMWEEILRERFCVEVTDIDTGFKRDRFNGFFELDEEGREMAEGAISGLRRLHIITEDGRIDPEAIQRNIERMQKLLIELNGAKVKTVCRLALADLRKDPDTKVVICAHFLKHQTQIKEELEFYGPLVLCGEVDQASRPKILANFNAPNNKHRVLIMSPGVGGEGVDLDDKDGRFPRRMYIIPTFNFHQMFQAAGRIYRRGMRSDSWVCFVYASNASIESILVNTMVKTKVAETVLMPGSKTVFPGDYPFLIENEDKSKEEHQALRAELTRVQKENKN